MLKHSYLDSPGDFKIFAHRGLIYLKNKIAFDENTLSAFQAALTAGANYLELDVQASADGVAIVFHDDVLDRVSSQTGKVAERTWSELQVIQLNHGGRISSLEEVLEKFPQAKINIDVKNSNAIEGLSVAVIKHQAQNRVLLTSFSEIRRRAAVRAVSGAATSPSAILVLLIKMAQVSGIGLTRLLKKVNVLQIPVSYGVMRLDSPKFIESVKRRGVEVVYWTINDPAEAIRLKQNGANGIVTDRTDLMIPGLRQP